MVPLTSRHAVLPDAEKRPRIVAWPAAQFLRCSRSRLMPVGETWRVGPTAQRASYVQSTSKEQSAPPELFVIMAYPSAAKFILKRPWLKRWMMPLAEWYGNAAGYRQLGLR